ncbi:MAG: phosphate ABC transporter ATP-binding protein [Syntrophomonas sp.]|nr:phosphate ABC transporter ATP-binding protein [Syntrophomonas sp.]
MTPVFKLHKIIKRYGQREVLHIDELTIPRQKICAILGPNGSGKTTLMRIMALLTRNDTGKVDVLGEDIHWGKEQLLKLRRQMTMVTQTSFMFEGSVYDNVAFGLKVRGKKQREIRPAVEKSLQLLGMSAFIAADARNLSGGERQKVAIARALAVEPRVLFLDEPTANIDPQSAVEIEHHVQFINRELGTTIILVTHNLFQARRLADEVFFMWDGKMVEQGSAKEIFEQPQDERTRSFLSGETVF